MTPEQIRNTRHRLRLSCSEFAKALKFTGKNAHITVYRWETGQRTPSDETVRRIGRLVEKGGERG